MEEALGQLIGMTLPDARKLCSGTRFLVRETNGKFAKPDGTARIVRVRRQGEELEVLLTRFSEDGIEA